MITRDSHLVITDHSTGYAPIWLGRGQIVGVGVQQQQTLVTNTRHTGRFTFGRVSRSGFFNADTTGGRSRSVTHAVDSAFLEIRYQFECNGLVGTAVVPFGNDRRSTMELCTAISRLQGAS